jgi:Family of unknown function (DUF6544)
VSAALDVPRAVRRIAREWAEVATTPRPASQFELPVVATLPEAVQRWLRHAIPEGTPLFQSAELEMAGEIRIGRWRSFTARQVLAPGRGYIWAARTHVGGLPVSGFDRLTRGSGEMRWRLLGLVPVLSATVPDVSRSAWGRLAGELVLVPTAFQRATWAAGSDADAALASCRNGDNIETAELRVASDGGLREVVVERWGNPDGKRFERCPFGVSVAAERRLSGLTIASELTAGWWWGTDRQHEGEFFRARITAATFR